LAVLPRDDTLSIDHVEHRLQAGVCFVGGEKATRILCVFLDVVLLAFELSGFLDTRPDDGSGGGYQHIVLLWRSRDDLINGLRKTGDGVAHGGKRLRYIYVSDC
jgi:hypothetical protein